MKKLYLNPFQGNVVQVALTHVYEECAFLTEPKIELIKLLIKRLDIDYPSDISLYDYEINIICFALGKNLEMQEDLLLDFKNDGSILEFNEYEFTNDIIKEINSIMLNLIGG